MPSLARIKKLVSMFFVVFCFQYMVICYIFAQSDVPHKHKLIPRHVTTKEIRGPTYHVHKVDPMSLAMRERYESRRLLVESNRPRLISRREILNEYRQPSSPRIHSTTQTESRRYIPLETETNRGKLLHCGTCSLVSNSGHILRSRMGDEIDEADCVFRLNAAPTLGYERDVGRRTTARVVSHRGMRELVSNASTLLDNHPSLTTVFIHGPDHVFLVGSLPKFVSGLSTKYPKLDFYRPSDVMDKELDADYEKYTEKTRISSGTEFSSGLYALMIMKDVCSDIKVYGVSPEDYCRLHPDSKVPYSYFKTPTLPECLMYDYHENIEYGGQRLATERLVFNGWAKTNNINFRNPEWE
ncbi:alpha-N-acetyl-neuraminyl-2,3-beta-galactosyl-1,3-N-acetyl-galactosaminide alpha-2,6-sialyltransferase-like [Acanthaster planci]|uniref:Alpha-N-acetyl-neuraminyl-2,3-beta-galactosyl-1, 3-N-acetyl-galactosaminide alpha-2,6-sialyltransferase-like n=1 Tax=Acanthaster planci TaxID=133434 RepID=A0A8B7ZJJ9_ACAPL|nr:alpha-N-acetyl-neuraminyl-2,3-beta-galactosyl-1,3-N-acetyl-galactosaminide alpha-2,6-sialyltransferase-like [Acanthaster planci]XP_022103467.1 alpha-N-acetyl-neuraminyl-2,3-beta-galactosyl-1,3-N-acetyl-galactosaminide alpha-2,6-sialyltransferase-like [Acanthaster planci]